jgi:cyclic beta-1,2-glucan synthetase
LLRSELFSIEQLKRHAVTLAGQHRIDPRPGPDRLLPRLADNARVLLAAYDVVTAAATPGQRIVPAEAWLLDNFYLIEQQITVWRAGICRADTAASCRAWPMARRPASRASTTWRWN